NELRVTPKRVEYLNTGPCYRYSPSVLRQRQQIPAQCFLHTYCLRTDAIRAIGGWDLQFSNPARSFAFEEVDATYSLYMAGYDLYVIPAAILWHLRSKNRSLAWRYDAKRVRAGYKINERLFIGKWLGKERQK
ncbi:MAG: hypothetical protein HYZ73_04820, partial [Elusimicrobia bacterium]|nr:hypothetical protein [Elusimicrobiota bacterium]